MHKIKVKGTTGMREEGYEGSRHVSQVWAFLARNKANNVTTLIYPN